MFHWIPGLFVLCDGNVFIAFQDNSCFKQDNIALQRSNLLGDEYIVDVGFITEKRFILLLL
jgi:hypothetical protein